MPRREISGATDTAVIVINGVRQNTAHKSVHTGKEAAIGPRTARLRGHAHTHFEPATDHYAVGARSGAALRSPTYPCGASGCGEAMRTVLMRRYCGRHGASRDPMQGAREGKFETRTGPQLKITYACCA